MGKPMTQGIQAMQIVSRMQTGRFSVKQMGCACIQLMLSFFGAGTVMAAPAVYETTTADGRLVYSNTPPNAGARVVLPSAAPVRSNAIVITGTSYGVLAAQPSRPPSGGRRNTKPEIDRLIAVLARHYGVDPHLVRAVVEVESGFNTHARSPKGATGLMQLMPATAARYHNESLYDPVKNIEAGVLYLRDLLKMFGGDPELALAGYNAGEGAVLKYKRRIPPYAETQQYVPKVLAAWQRNRADARIPRMSTQGVRVQ
jgi:soluble lytic murein transglycosylase-like protein